MQTETIQFALPESLRDFVAAQVAEGGYRDPGEYLQALVREEQIRRAAEQVEEHVLKGLNSGEPVEATDDWWRRKKERLAEQFGREE